MGLSYSLFSLLPPLKLFFDPAPLGFGFWISDLSEKGETFVSITPQRVALLALAVYMISLALPVFGRAFGIMALALGWCPPYTPFWIANLAFAYGVRKLARNDCRRGRNAGVVATILAILYLPAHLWEDASRPLLIGYYTWAGSMVIVWAGGWITGRWPVSCGTQSTPSAAAADVATGKTVMPRLSAWSARL